jgi:pilus assembly protein Flp/PilA
MPALRRELERATGTLSPYFHARRREEDERGVLGMYARLRGLLAREDGQGLVEYALILVLVAIVVVGVLTALGTRVQVAFNDIVAKLGG